MSEIASKSFGSASKLFKFLNSFIISVQVHSHHFFIWLFQ